MLNTVAGLKEAGGAVLLVEQKVDAALRVCDRIVFIENGGIQEESTPIQLTANPEPLQRYVGVRR